MLVLLALEDPDTDSEEDEEEDEEEADALGSDVVVSCTATEAALA